MSNILVTVAETDTPVPAGSTFGQLDIVVTDAGGAVQTQSLKSAPWSATFTLATDGPGSVTATAKDSTGVTMGMPGTVTQAFSTTVTPPAVFPQPTAITVTPA